MEEVTFFYESLTDDNLLHIGGFNEKIQLYDLRKPKHVLRESEAQGGGVWRMDGKLVNGKEYIAICTCSGNEFRILDSEYNLVASSKSSDESWAYGIEWLDNVSESDNRLGACSFYDNSTYIFDFEP